MKKTVKISFCAIVAALSFAVMMASHFEYLTYAIPAIAGLFIIVPLIEMDKRWALATYIVVSALTFFSAETTSMLLYIGFFGYYPVVKAMIEKLQRPIAEWAIKVLLLNCAIAAVYFASVVVVGITLSDFGEFGKYGAVIILVAFNVIFVMYDIGVSRIASAYMVRLHPFVKKNLFCKK